jgi:hypothetical protein
MTKVFKRMFGAYRPKCLADRNFCHQRYLLYRIESPHTKTRYVWEQEDGRQVGPTYYSYKTADWSFGEWIAQAPAQASRTNSQPEQAATR